VPGVSLPPGPRLLRRVSLVDVGERLSSPERRERPKLREEAVRPARRRDGNRLVRRRDRRDGPTPPPNPANPNCIITGTGPVALAGWSESPNIDGDLRVRGVVYMTHSFW